MKNKIYNNQILYFIYYNTIDKNQGGFKNINN